MVDKSKSAIGREFMRRVARSLQQEMQMLLVRTWGQPEFVLYTKRDRGSRLVQFGCIRREMQTKIREAIMEMHPPRSFLISEGGVIDELYAQLRSNYSMSPPELLLAPRAEAREFLLNRR